MDRRSGINTALKSQKSALLGSRSQGNNSTGQLGNGTTNTDINRTPVYALVTVAPSALPADADKVFAWAERNYQQFFSSTGAGTQTLPRYRYRAYASGTFLAVNDDANVPRLYYLGPASSNTVLDLGLLSTWLTQAAP